MPTPRRGAAAPASTSSAGRSTYVIVDGKMRGLFSMLFGASTLLVIDRATAAGRGGAKAHYARMAVLLGFGLRPLLLHLVRRHPRALRIVGNDPLLVPQQEPALAGPLGDRLHVARHNLLRAGRFVGAVAGTSVVSPRTSSELMESRRTIETEVGATSKKIPADLKLYRSDYKTIMESRLIGRTLGAVRLLLRVRARNPRPDVHRHGVVQVGLPHRRVARGPLPPLGGPLRRGRLARARLPRLVAGQLELQFGARVRRLHQPVDAVRRADGDRLGGVDHPVGQERPDAGAEGPRRGRPGGWRSPIISPPRSS